MTDFLLELRSEEIPARMQGKAKEDLARLFNEALAKAGLAAESVETFATPRRLALIAKGLPLATEAVAEETKGPKVGAPPQAMEGFLRKTGLTQDQLVERDGVYFAVVEKAGRNTADVLSQAIFAITATFPWPKSMRWGEESFSTASLRWVRPLKGIVALFGDDVVEFELTSHADVYANNKGDMDIVRVLKNVRAGRETMGHRFHSSGPVTIANADAYIEKLREAHVIVHFSERCAIIRDGAKAAAEAAGLTLVEDEGLVVENAGLTEWPVPMLGRFDPAFLEVPEEVIQLTARVNQKYFVCHDANGKLANAFVCTANIVANDNGAAIVAGNEKVLAARLSDAKFFWEQDLKVALDEQAKRLSQITFHEKLGTVADKVERVAKLARWLVEEGIVKGASADDAERAARLCKADLVTGMVGEFPELQGIMGGYYARAQAESDAVADAIRDHYKPVGQGDDVPTAPVTVAVSLADKLDTLVGFFSEGMPPTGSKDPFALRRAAIGHLDVVQLAALRMSTKVAAGRAVRIRAQQLVDKSKAIDPGVAKLMLELPLEGSATPTISKKLNQMLDASSEIGLALKADYDPLAVQLADDALRILEERERIESQLLDFFADRLKVQQREAGVRHDLIDAVFALGGEDDLVRLLARVKALQAFVATDEGVNLLAGYKRAANILKQSGAPAKAGAVAGVALPDPTPLPAQEHMVDEELSLLSALDTAEPKAAAAVDAEDFEGSMAALASLRAPIDAFFDGVMVNDPDPDKRAFRLGLLARFRDAVHRVADFSKIEG